MRVSSNPEKSVIWCAVASVHVYQRGDSEFNENIFIHLNANGFCPKWVKSDKKLTNYESYWPLVVEVPRHSSLHIPEHCSPIRKRAFRKSPNDYLRIYKSTSAS